MRTLVEFVTDLNHHTPICVPCQRNYRCELNGILVRLGPDRMIDADLYKCPACGHLIVKGFAREYVDRYGRHRSLFDAQDARMGDAMITDYTGRPITLGQDGLIPREEAPEAASDDD